jgi:ribonuclease R
MSPPPNRRKSGDPHAAREAERYARPIASREHILETLQREGRPLDAAALAAALGDRDPAALEALAKRLGAMVREGQLVLNRREEYVLPNRVGVVAGTVQGHRDGFGFLVRDDGGPDVFLGPRQMRELMHGDRASVRIMGEDDRGRPQGSVVDVLERGTTRLVGRVVREGGVDFVTPDNPRFAMDVLLPPGSLNGATPGQIVVVAVVEPPTKVSGPVGRVIKVLGDHRAAGMEVEIAIHSHGLPHEFGLDVVGEAEAFGDAVAERDKQGRLDLRELPLCTIDGADARDFDDAIYASPSGDGWRLIVAIADVSHYVRPGTALDREAHARGTSVYFPDWVIPMLPENLSNGLCSLNPQVDRLCTVCEMRIDKQGKVSRARFDRAVMRSHARLTYDEVGAYFGGDPRVAQRLGPLATQIDHLRGVFRALLGARHRRGAIEFERPETKIKFTANRRIERIVPVVRNDAHRLVEECMIAANVEAARFIARHNLPTLYRVHERPKPEKITALREFLWPLGVKLEGGAEPEPRDLAAVVSAVADRPDRHLVETVVLRSMAQARYQPEDVGHFGLALQTYAHFTSPIRRYPDLMVHRAIGHIVEGRDAASFHPSRPAFDSLGTHCSTTERRADDATRDAVAWLKCEFMEERIGEEFEGTISSIVPFGAFVELDGLYVEGLIHVTSLPSDYWEHDPAHHRLVASRSGQVIRLADRVTVKVARVDLDQRKIDFELTAHKPTVRSQAREPGHPERGKPLADRGAKKGGGKDAGKGGRHGGRDGGRKGGGKRGRSTRRG